MTKTKEILIAMKRNLIINTDMIAFKQMNLTGILR